MTKRGISGSLNGYRMLAGSERHLCHINEKRRGTIKGRERVRQGAIHIIIPMLALTGFSVSVAVSPEPADDLVSAPSPAILVVPRADLRAAMEAEGSLPYDASVTTNAARYFAGVVLRLARDAQMADPAGLPLLLRHDYWWAAALDIAGLEPEAAPGQLRLAYDYRQDVLIDYGQGRVVKSVADGRWPDVAVNLQIGWADSADLPSRFSYDDTLSTPKLHVTNHRLIKHRLLRFGDIVVYDETSGLTGRPTSGLLSLLFRVIGEGRVDWTRIFIAEDGTQVVRGRASKGPFAVTETIFVRPDGVAEKGLPAESPEWRAIEARLERMPDIEYHEWTLPDFDAGWYRRDEVRR